MTNQQITIWEPPQGIAPNTASKIVCSFLDAAATSFGRATHHSSREEQQKTELQAHDKMIGLDRDLYAAFLTLPGVTDRSRQLGLRNLLSYPHKEDGMLTAEQETNLLYGLLKKIPAQRLLKIIDAFRFTDLEQGIVKANNARTRKLILRTILNARHLEFWSVKYRQKIKRALIHAWGNRRAGIVKSILSKKPFARNQKEWDILKTLIDKHVFIGSRVGARRAEIQLNATYECVGFVLGVRDNTLPLLKAFEEAKKDLAAGSILMPEVLEGIRATYHPNIPKEEVIRLTTKSGSMTTNQKLAMQKLAEESEAVLEFDPNQYDAIKLYIYAFERGMTKRIARALDEKARKAAEKFPISYKNVGLLIDASKSMAGDGSQPLRPIATALSVRDMLRYTGRRFVVTYAAGGLLRHGDDRLVYPQGDSYLAEGLIALIEQDNPPDVIFVISDGHEAEPGHFAEAFRDIDMSLPIYHLNPVMPTKTEKLRQISPDIVSVPIQRTDALGLTILRGLVENDPVNAINILLQLALDSGMMRKALQS